MKLIFNTFILFLFFLVISCTFSNDKYENNNGEIISITKRAHYVTTKRKHNQSINFGNSARQENMSLYREPVIDQNKVINTISIGDSVNVYEILSIENMNNKKCQIFLKVKTSNGIIGWIYLGDYDPYDKDTWQVVKEYKFKNKIWKSRKLYQKMAVLEQIYLYNKPGMENATVTYTYKTGQNSFIIETLEILDKEDNINNVSDYWVKIKTTDGEIGWVFGSNLGIERGGPKYLTPDNTISFALGYY